MRSSSRAGLTFATAVALLLAVASGADAAPIRDATAAQAPTCKRERAAVKTFKRAMPRRKRAYYRTHRSKRQRRAYVRRQRARLRRLQRRLDRCRRAATAPAPSSPPVTTTPPPAAPPAPDQTPPDLAITAPADFAWHDEPVARVHGTVTDAGSGVASLTCNGAAAARAGDAFSCDIALTQGETSYTVAAADASGNSVSQTRIARYAVGVLPGPPDASVVAAARDFDADDVTEPAEVVVDPGGRRLSRTKLEIGFQPGATVDQVNAVLLDYGAQTTSMLQGVAIVVVRIPDPGSLAALHGVAQDIRGEAGVRFVRLAVLPELDELPSNFQPLGIRSGLIEHHLAVRAPAAWNARHRLALADRPLVVVADSFGGGQPISGLAVDGPLAIDLTGSPDAHGYHVAGIIAATFEGDVDPRGSVTGIFPASSRMAAVDSLRIGSREAAGELDFPTYMDRIVEVIRNEPGNVVLNTSINHCDADGACTDPEESRDAALAWIERVRGTSGVTTPGAGLEHRFLQFTSAGNRKGLLSPLGPDNNSPWTAAARFGGLQTAAGASVPNMTNIVVVENAVGSGGTRAQCLNESSKRPGDVSAIGTNVWSFMDATTDADFQSGTSMATPQAAGLAAYLWTLEPAMNPLELARLMTTTVDTVERTGFSGACDGTTDPVGLLDAYGALIALDDPTAATPVTAPNRLAVLDVHPAPAGDGDLDEEDLNAYAAALFNGDAEVEPSGEDYGRHDLNGDGFTGGASNDAAHDLDRTGSPLWAAGALSTVTRTIEGLPIRFDEREVTDGQALCFYAYSGLYTGAAAARTSALGLGRCLDLGLTMTLDSAIPPGTDAPLVIDANNLRTGLVQPGVHVDLTAEGGSLGAQSATTGADGSFSTTVRLDPGSASVTVEAVARNAPGGTVLATASGSASAAGGTATKFDSFGSTVTGSDSKFSPPGATSFEATTQASFSDPDSGNFFSATGGTQFVETIEDGDTLVEVTARSEGTASASGFRGTGGGDYGIVFDVEGGPVAYSITGFVTASPSRTSDCILINQPRAVVQLDAVGPPRSTLFLRCAPLDPMPVATSGTLSPGRYEFSMNAVATTVAGSSDATAEATLTLG